MVVALLGPRLLAKYCQIATANGKYDACQYLIKQTGLANSGIATLAISQAWASAADEGRLESLFRLFLEHSDVDLDINEIHGWDLCDMTTHHPLPREVIRLIQGCQHLDYFSRPLGDRLESGLRIAVAYKGRLPFPTVLHWIGIEGIIEAVARYHTNDGLTMLYIVLRNLPLSVEREDGTEVARLQQAARALVALGADLTRMNGSLGTPLMAMLHCTDVYSLQILLRYWTQVLQGKGLDIQEYIELESCHWEIDRPSRGLRHLDSCSGGDGLEIIKLFFNEARDTIDTVLHRYYSPYQYELRSIPGSWPGKQHVPTTICWKPNDLEKEEGEWASFSVSRLFETGTRTLSEAAACHP